MSKYLHAPEITEEVIQKAFEGANFGRTDYREFLGYSVLKKACHWYCGHTITSIMIELKLIGPNTHRLTKLGRMFLSDCYDDPLRNKPAPSAPDGYCLVKKSDVLTVLRPSETSSHGFSIPIDNCLWEAGERMFKAAAPESD